MSFATASAPQISADPRERKIYLQRIALILAAALIVYLIGNGSVGLWDRDEPRNAEASRQMLQSGDWVVPHFLGEVRAAKPIMIYWCEAGAMKLLGDNKFAARLPSSIAMLMSLVVLALTLPRAVGFDRAAWAVFILTSSALAVAAAKMCLTDSILLLWIAIGEICLFLILNRRDSMRTWIIFGVALGMAALTKGPVMFGVLGMTAASLIVIRAIDSKLKSRQISPLINVPIAWHRIILRLLAAGVIVFAICLPWLILVHEREPNFLRTIVERDMVQRLRSGLEGHVAPPGFYLATVWFTYFPWSFLLPAAIAFGWKNRSDPLARFALAAVIGPWLMFEIVKAKLPHYLLPIFPPLALLTAMALTNLSTKVRRTMCGVGIATLIVVTVGYGFVLPKIEAIRVSQNVGKVLRDHGATRRGDVIMIDYKEPSLAFEQGGTIREESQNTFLATHDAREWPTWIVMTEQIWNASPPRVRQRLDRIASVRGWWYANKGKPVVVIVAKKK